MTTTNPADTSLPAPANDTTGAVAVVKGYWKPVLAVIAGAVAIGFALHLADRSGIEVALIAAKWGFPAGAAVVAGLMLHLHAMSSGRVLRWVVLPAMIASIVAASALSVYDTGASDARAALAPDIAKLKSDLAEATQKPRAEPVAAAALSPLPMPPPTVETPPAPAAVSPRPIRRPKPRSTVAKSDAGATLETMKWPF